MDIAQSVRDLYNLRCISTPFNSIIKSNNNSSILRSDDDSVMHDRVLLLWQNRFINLRFVVFVFFMLHVWSDNARANMLKRFFYNRVCINNTSPSHPIVMTSRHCGEGVVMWNGKSAFFVCSETETHELRHVEKINATTWKIGSLNFVNSLNKHIISKYSSESWI